MNWTQYLPEVITGVSTLLVAFLGHTAASMSLRGALKHLVSDLQGGHSVANLQKDVDDMKEVIDDVKAVLAEAKAKAQDQAAPNA